MLQTCKISLFNSWSKRYHAQRWRWFFARACVNQGENMTRVFSRAALAALAAGLFAALASLAYAAPACPIEDPGIEAAKSHKLYLYFPTADDAGYPNFVTGSTPADHFDVAQLSSGIGTTAQLRDAIHDIVTDDYCEFNVQVLETTTNPDTLPSPPALRHTVAIGSDVSGGFGTWGYTQSLANPDVNYARVWAGAYVGCEGGNGAGGCSAEGSLTGANDTLANWAQAIGGTAAHEGGHTATALPTPTTTRRRVHRAARTALARLLAKTLTPAT